MIAHIIGIPLEETIVSLGPALFLVLGAALARLRNLKGSDLLRR